MKAGLSLKRGLAEVWRAWEAEHYDLALAKLDRLVELNPANAPLLIMRAQLIQLQEGPNEPTPPYDDALADLKLATALDTQSPVALIELGYLLYAVADDAKTASKYFRKAIPVCRDLLREALLGQAKALADQEEDAEALACLVEAYSLRTHNGKSGGEDVLEQLRMLQRVP